MPLYIQSIFVFHKYDNLNNKRYNPLFEKADELGKILFSILKKTRLKK